MEIVERNMSKADMRGTAILLRQCYALARIGKARSRSR